MAGGAVQDAEQERFMGAEGWHLAMRLHERTGWPLVGVTAPGDRVGRVVEHAAVCNPHGVYHDVRGRQTRAALLSAFRGRSTRAVIELPRNDALAWLRLATGREWSAVAADARRALDTLIDDLFPTVAWQHPVPRALTPAEAAANFRRWFGRSQVVDGTGQPLVVCHATQAVFDVFEAQSGKDHGFHFGSRPQAEMRRRPDGFIMEVYLSAQNLKRLKDIDGRWTKEQIQAAKRQGYDGIVYLNRYEGLTAERIDALQASGAMKRLDRLSDREFKRYVPEAEDSFIVFEPTQIKSIHNPGTWSPHDPRIDDGAALHATAEAPNHPALEDRERAPGPR